MPKNVARLIAESAREHYVVLDRTIYAIRRINSDQLRHHGWAELEGASSVKAALEQIDREAEDLRKRIDPKRRKKPDDELRMKLLELQRSRMLAIYSRPESAEAQLARCTAYICAAVVGAGRLRDDVDLKELVVVLPDDADPATLAEDLRLPDEIEHGAPPVYLAPVRFVQDEAAEDLDHAITWVHRLSAIQRSTLGALVIDLQSVAGEVTSFRRAAGAAGGVLEAGEGDGALAARGAGAGPVAGGVRDPVPAGRRDRGRQGRSGSEARVPGRADRVK